MDETVNDGIVFDASDISPVANELTEEQAEETNSSAVEETSEGPAREDESSAEPAVSETQTGDVEIDEFLSKKGIDLNDPDAIRKVAKMYQNAEKGFYAKSQEKAQLERRLAEQSSQPPSTNPNDLALSEVRSMRMEMDVEKWKTQRNLSAEDEQKMMDYLSQPVTDRNGNIQRWPDGRPISKGVLVTQGIYSLDDVFKLSGCGEVKVDNLKNNLREEVRKEMVARQNARRPSAKATDSTQFGKPKQDDPFMKALLGE